MKYPFHRPIWKSIPITAIKDVYKKINLFFILLISRKFNVKIGAKNNINVKINSEIDKLDFKEKIGMKDNTEIKLTFKDFINKDT